MRALLSYMDFEGQLYFWRARGGNEVDILISCGQRPVWAPGKTKHSLEYRVYNIM
ncbi:MAG: hypothetical protein HYU00_01475 [Nitrosarchaeum sp.]|nr:hypothetical protein [Nitrosarchaeum sp.]